MAAVEDGYNTALRVFSSTCGQWGATCEIITTLFWELAAVVFSTSIAYTTSLHE